MGKGENLLRSILTLFDVNYIIKLVRVTGVSDSLFTDVNALQNVKGAKDAELVVGGYHYARFKNLMKQ